MFKVILIAHLISGSMILSMNDYTRLSKIAISGVVVHAGSTKPIPNVVVFSVRGEEEALTDSLGRFHLTTWQSLPILITAEHADYGSGRISVNKSTKDLMIILTDK